MFLSFNGYIKQEGYFKLFVLGQDSVKMCNLMYFDRAFCLLTNRKLDLLTRIANLLHARVFISLLMLVPVAAQSHINKWFT
jgi:hypothetical protein